MKGRMRNSTRELNNHGSKPDAGTGEKTFKEALIDSTKKVGLVNNIRVQKVANGIQVRPCGGKQVNLTFPSVELRDRTLAQGKELLQVWFSEVQSWEPSFSMGRHREVWLSCFGVPLELWGISTFCEIGSKWGEVLAIEEDTARNLTFYCGKVKILTNCLEYINFAVNLTCEGKSCLIRVLEEQVVLVNKIVGQSDHDSESSSSTDSERHSGRPGDFALSDQVFYSHVQSDLVKDRNHNAIALERVLACDGPQSMLRDQSVLRDQILRHGNGREDELVPSDVDDDDLASPSKGINSQHWIDEDNNGGSRDPRNSGGLIEEDAEKAADDSGSRVEDTTWVYGLDILKTKDKTGMGTGVTEHRHVHLESSGSEDGILHFGKYNLRSLSRRFPISGWEGEHQKGSVSNKVGQSSSAATGNQEP
ncbi:hypothetical protein Dimus_023054 [Dionaea muscipula]